MQRDSLPRGRIKKRNHIMARQKQSKKSSSEKNNEGDKEVNWTLTLIMSVVFGQLGVDRFIMGHVGLGILKLITFGGCGVWWLVDLILIATKHEFNGIKWVEK